MWEVAYIKSVASQISLPLVTSADAARYLEKPFSVGCHEVCWSDIIVLVISSCLDFFSLCVRFFHLFPKLRLFGCWCYTMDIA